MTMPKLRSITASLLVLTLPQLANAAFCDYRPSEIVGKVGAAIVPSATGAIAATGAGAKAAGVYTLVHSTSGLTMVGGTWAGSSAAGTAGIIGGTGGLVGTAVAVVTAPATITAGAVTAVAVGSYEGVCYFTDTRITDYDEINAIIADIAVTAPPALYKYYPGPEGEQEAMVQIRDPDSEEKKFNLFKVKDLYIVNGDLKNRDWGLNTNIGSIAVIGR